ncbi:MAG TPA: hypothetical protein VLL25_14005, partial [Acidimicrobiales bacterium]|nr:hypothetical protein [Acidimicrobiales bacterium]
KSTAWHHHLGALGETSTLIDSVVKGCRRDTRSNDPSGLGSGSATPVVKCSRGQQQPSSSQLRSSSVPVDPDQLNGMGNTRSELMEEQSGTTTDIEHPPRCWSDLDGPVHDLSV